METPPTASSPPEATDAPRSRIRHIRMAVWAVFTLVLLGFIAFGSVPAISYTYYAFSGRVVRLAPQRSMIDIWRDAIAELPAFSVDWLPGAIVAASIAIAVLCAIGGAWMLLVQAPDARARSIRSE